jgi:hypothetical protein
VPALKTEIPLWLENWKFDRFVTLATNGANLPARILGSRHDRLTGLLEEWDGRMNRKLAGPKWSKRPEDRMWAFYFLEKPAANPHCGVVLRRSRAAHAGVGADLARHGLVRARATNSLARPSPNCFDRGCGAGDCLL